MNIWKNKKIFRFKKNLKNNKLKFVSGFTLVEIMVATSIFIVIMIMAMGSLITTSKEAKDARKVALVMDNLNFALENITRSLRMGTNYHCGSLSAVESFQSFSPLDCQDSKTMIAFIPTDADTGNKVRAFKLFSSSDGKKTIQRCTIDSKCQKLLSDEVDVQEFKVYVKGSSSSDKIQPTVYILLKANVSIDGQNIPFAMQTMVSQRSSE